MYEFEFGAEEVLQLLSNELSWVPVINVIRGENTVDEGEQNDSPAR